MADIKMNPKLQILIPVVKGLAKTLGPDYEVNLHDLSMPEHSLVMCENGHVTGRKPGSPMTDFGLFMMQSEEYKDKEGVYNYLARNNRGEPIKCSALFIRDENNKLIGFLCINHDLSKVIVAESLFSQFLKFSDEPVKQYNHLSGPHQPPEDKFPAPVKEWFAQDLDEVVSDSLNQIKARIDKPLKYLSKAEKEDVIRELRDKGFFLLKGAVDIVAEEMGNTKYTIYAYIRSVEKQDKGEGKRKKTGRKRSRK